MDGSFSRMDVCLAAVESSPSQRVSREEEMVSLACAAYEERALPSGQLDPSRLGVLADALEWKAEDSAGAAKGIRRGFEGFAAGRRRTSQEFADEHREKH